MLRPDRGQHPRGYLRPVVFGGLPGFTQSGTTSGIFYSDCPVGGQKRGFYMRRRMHAGTCDSCNRLISWFAFLC